MKKRLFAIAAVFVLLPQIFIAAAAQSISIDGHFLWGGNSYSFDYVNQNSTLSFADAGGNVGVLLGLSSYRDITDSAIVYFSVTFNSPDKSMSGLLCNYVYSNYTDSKTYSDRKLLRVINNNTTMPLGNGTANLYTTATFVTSGSTPSNVCNYQFALILPPSDQLGMVVGSAIRNLYFNFKLPSEVTSAQVTFTGPDVILVDSSAEDLAAVISGISSNTSGIVNGISGLSNDVQYLNRDTQNSLQAVQSAVDLVKKSVDDFSNTFTDKLEQHDKNLLDEATQALDSNVSGIMDQLPFSSEISQSTSTFQSVLSACSTDSTDCSLVLPAGDVSIAGTSYHFWDEQTIDLNPVFSNQYIQLLLVAVRFIFGFSFLRYMFVWANNIIKLILLEDTSNELQENINDSKRGGRRIFMRD